MVTPLSPAVLQSLMSRRYYEVFYPHNGSYISAPDHNMWLTQCGTGKYNLADDVASPPPAGRRLLQRSNTKW